MDIDFKIICLIITVLVNQLFNLTSAKGTFYLINESIRIHENIELKIVFYSINKSKAFIKNEKSHVRRSFNGTKFFLANRILIELENQINWIEKRYIGLGFHEIHKEEKDSHDRRNNNRQKRYLKDHTVIDLSVVGGFFGMASAKNLIQLQSSIVDLDKSLMKQNRDITYEIVTVHKEIQVLTKLNQIADRQTDKIFFFNYMCTKLTFIYERLLLIFTEIRNIMLDRNGIASKLVFTGLNKDIKHRIGKNKKKMAMVNFGNLTKISKFRGGIEKKVTNKGIDITLEIPILNTDDICTSTDKNTTTNDKISLICKNYKTEIDKSLCYRIDNDKHAHDNSPTETICQTRPCESLDIQNTTNNTCTTLDDKHFKIITDKLTPCSIKTTLENKQTKETQTMLQGQKIVYLPENSELKCNSFFIRKSKKDGQIIHKTDLDLHMIFDLTSDLTNLNITNSTSDILIKELTLINKRNLTNLRDDLNDLQKIGKDMEGWGGEQSSQHN